MPEKFRIDSSEPPEIAVAITRVAWDDIDTCVRFVRSALALGPDDRNFRGYYMDPLTKMPASTVDLGTDQEEAIKLFRDFLRRPVST
jgi:hypothetical protein